MKKYTVSLLASLVFIGLCNSDVVIAGDDWVSVCEGKNYGAPCSYVTDSEQVVRATCRWTRSSGGLGPLMCLPRNVD